MSFSDWMSARGQDLAITVAAAKNISKVIADVTVKATKDVGEGFSAFKTGYQLKRVDSLCNIAQKEEKQ